MISGGNNFNQFAENQLTKFHRKDKKKLSLHAKGASPTHPINTQLETYAKDTRKCVTVNIVAVNFRHQAVSNSI